MGWTDDDLLQIFCETLWWNLPKRACIIKHTTSQNNSPIELTPDQYEIYNVDEQDKCLPAAEE